MKFSKAVTALAAATGLSLLACKGRGKGLGWWLKVPQMTKTLLMHQGARLADQNGHSWRRRFLTWAVADYPNISAFSRHVPHTGGQWATEDLEVCAAKVAQVPGDFAEIGVWKGAAFSRLIPLAEAQNKTCHAFDSFVGMAPQTPEDGAFEEGTFNVGGVAGFEQLMRDRGLETDRYHTYEGWIPDCLEKAPADLQLSFVILDVDRQFPTRDALAWLWPRLAVGGILALDDYFTDWDNDCSKAINHWLRHTTDFQLLNYTNNQLIVRKVASA